MEVRLGRYKHFKGKMYEVLGIARNSENPGEEFVVYRALYKSEEFGDSAMWIRPKAMFLEKVEKDGKIISRFKYIGTND
ncbi:MAG: DUF1653 domain-containing protein [Candidatus Micrarchaeales archaeon]